jgi:hypothetical protein
MVEEFIEDEWEIIGTPPEISKFVYSVPLGDKLELSDDEYIEDYLPITTLNIIEKSNDQKT